MKDSKYNVANIRLWFKENNLDKLNFALKYIKEQYWFLFRLLDTTKIDIDKNYNRLHKEFFNGAFYKSNEKYAYLRYTDRLGEYSTKIFTIDEFIHIVKDKDYIITYNKRLKILELKNNIKEFSKYIDVIKNTKE